MAKLVVGIGGGVAAYKTAMAVSQLVQRGHDVHVVLTRGGRKFVGAATLAALCGRPPVEDTYDPAFPLGPHIELARGAAMLIIAPATARILASCAWALADDLLSTLYLARDCPTLMAPAMNATMWQQPAVQRNVLQLQRDGVDFIGPESGWLSCRDQGPGRMVEPQRLVEAIERKLGLGGEGSVPADG
ncbi:MAG: phosphopantothenoylcysteine decarboxylase [Pirellulaceae bacterium]|nr:MAG: phosphopantothenoylcysteine decarboxylase [Pirellulaceae bacterium]